MEGRRRPRRASALYDVELRGHELDRDDALDVDLDLTHSNDRATTRCLLFDLAHLTDVGSGLGLLRSVVPSLHGRVREASLTTDIIDGIVDGTGTVKTLSASATGRGVSTTHRPSPTCVANAFMRRRSRALTPVPAAHPVPQLLDALEPRATTSRTGPQEHVVMACLASIRV